MLGSTVCLDGTVKPISGQGLSPMGDGICSSDYADGTMKTGRDGETWVVRRDRNNTHRWHRMSPDGVLMYDTMYEYIQPSMFTNVRAGLLPGAHPAGAYYDDVSPWYMRGAHGPVLGVRAGLGLGIQNNNLRPAPAAAAANGLGKMPPRFVRDDVAYPDWKPGAAPAAAEPNAAPNAAPNAEPKAEPAGAAPQTPQHWYIILGDLHSNKQPVPFETLQKEADKMQTKIICGKAGGFITGNTHCEGVSSDAIVAGSLVVKGSQEALQLYLAHLAAKFARDTSKIKSSNNGKVGDLMMRTFRLNPIQIVYEQQDKGSDPTPSAPIEVSSSTSQQSQQQQQQQRPRWGVWGTST